jgi:uncharacterized Zn-binding protein involved in type VI secretion
MLSARKGLIGYRKETRGKTQRINRRMQMTRPFIVVGDRTSHGGVVVSGAQTIFADDKPIARVGDSVTCPLPGCPGSHVIISGDQSVIMEGQPVARDGDKTDCGATLISSQMATSSGSRGASGGAHAETAPASASAEHLSGEELVYASHAATFDDLPPKAQIYVYEQALKFGALFSPMDALTMPDTSKFKQSTGKGGVPILTTQDETTYMRLIRAHLGLAPNEKIDESRVLNSDPNMPDMRGVGPGHTSLLKPTAKVYLYGDTLGTIARFADARPMDGVGSPDGVDEVNPEVNPQLAGKGAAMNLIQIGVSGIKKWKKARDLGLKSKAVVYRDPNTHQLVVHIRDRQENVQGTALQDVDVTRRQATERLNSLAATGLGKEQKEFEDKQLNDFYHTYYFSGP